MKIYIKLIILGIFVSCVSINNEKNITIKKDSKNSKNHQPYIVYYSKSELKNIQPYLNEHGGGHSSESNDRKFRLNLEELKTYIKKNKKDKIKVNKDTKKDLEANNKNIFAFKPTFGTRWFSWFFASRYFLSTEADDCIDEYFTNEKCSDEIKKYLSIKNIKIDLPKAKDDPLQSDIVNFKDSKLFKSISNKIAGAGNNDDGFPTLSLFNEQTKSYDYINLNKQLVHGFIESIYKKKKLNEFNEDTFETIFESVFEDYDNEESIHKQAIAYAKKILKYILRKENSEELKSELCELYTIASGTPGSGKTFLGILIGIILEIFYKKKVCRIYTNEELNKLEEVLQKNEELPAFIIFDEISIGKNHDEEEEYISELKEAINGCIKKKIPFYITTNQKDLLNEYKNIKRLEFNLNSKRLDEHNKTFLSHDEFYEQYLKMVKSLKWNKSYSDPREQSTILIAPEDTFGWFPDIIGRALNEIEITLNDDLNLILDIIKSRKINGIVKLKFKEMTEYGVQSKFEDIFKALYDKNIRLLITGEKIEAINKEYINSLKQKYEKSLKENYDVNAGYLDRLKKVYIYNINSN